MAGQEILAAGGLRVRSRVECVPNPFDGLPPVAPGVDADNVESCPVGRVSPAGREKRFGGPDQLSLLVAVDRHRRARKRTRGSVANLDEHQAIVIEHDEVDFAVTAAEIVGDRRESAVSQVSKRELFGSVA